MHNPNPAKQRSFPPCLPLLLSMICGGDDWGDTEGTSSSSSPSGGANVCSSRCLLLSSSFSVSSLLALDLIAEQFEALGSGIGVKCTVLVGGVDMTQQAISLGKRPHIVVLDEADRLLNLEFEKAIDDILKVIPAERKTYLFSATMTKKVSIHFQVDFCIELQDEDLYI
ncbi:hypothetical protein BHM03_00001786 [Ensete ventricosum]|nr:hypothetical protein BHM03_00001786 [Ensete ventricosum]